MTIKEMRERTYLTQSKFAKIVGIPVGNIQKWEQGVYAPPDYVLELIEFKLRTLGLLTLPMPKGR